MTEFPNIKYRTHDGREDYEFTFTWRGPSQGWRIYIDRQPGYGPRNASAAATHRLGLGQRPYICWTHLIPDYKSAKYVAAMWADCTQNYIATGVFAPPPGRERDMTPVDISALANLPEQRLRSASQSPRPVRVDAPVRGSSLIERLRERIG